MKTLIASMAVVVTSSALVTGQAHGQVTKKSPFKAKDVRAPVGQLVVRFATGNQGKKVGSGHSSALVNAALESAGAKPGVKQDGKHIWGRPLSTGEAMKPGDIIQFESCTVGIEIRRQVQEVPIRDSWKLSQHTAIVKSASRKSIVVVHQNLPNSAKGVVKSDGKVREDAWELGRITGKYTVYRAVEKPSNAALKQPISVPVPGK